MLKMVNFMLCIFCHNFYDIQDESTEPRARQDGHRWLHLQQLCDFEEVTEPLRAMSRPLVENRDNKSVCVKGLL